MLTLMDQSRKHHVDIDERFIHYDENGRIWFDTELIVKSGNMEAAEIFGTDKTLELMQLYKQKNGFFPMKIVENRLFVVTIFRVVD